jgi:hypothetical protein
VQSAVDFGRGFGRVTITLVKALDTGLDHKLSIRWRCVALAEALPVTSFELGDRRVEIRQELSGVRDQPIDYVGFDLLEGLDQVFLSLFQVELILWLCVCGKFDEGMGTENELTLLKSDGQVGDHGIDLVDEL